jgi:hypothetical protein
VSVTIQPGEATTFPALPASFTKCPDRSLTSELGDDYQDWIKSANEPHERVVNESPLDRIA